MCQSPIDKEQDGVEKGECVGGEDNDTADIGDDTMYTNQGGYGEYNKVGAIYLDKLGAINQDFIHTYLLP